MASAILVVDDDRAIRGALQAVLEDEGYHVQAAGNGLEALAHCLDAMPALILLDLMMPKMDGEAFVRALRERATDMPPVLILSASRQAAQQAAQLGVAGYIAKPFDLDDLLHRVEQLVAA